MELGEDLAAELVLFFMELDGVGSTHLGYALRLAASFFNVLLEKRKKEAVSKSRGEQEWVGGYAEQRIPFQPGLCSKGLRECYEQLLWLQAVFDQFIQGRALGSGHTSPREYDTRATRQT